MTSYDLTGYKVTTLFLTIALTISSATPSNAEWITVKPKENRAPLKNPLKGWRGVNDHIATPGGQNAGMLMPTGSRYESMFKWYIGWDDIEESPEDGAEKIIRYMDHTFRGIEDQNLRVIPRIACINHQGPQHPGDLQTLTGYFNDPWFERPEVRARIERLVEKIGTAWDNDPRVAFVQMGIHGKYGEQWKLCQQPEVEQYLHDAFAKAFKHKKLMIRSAGSPDFASSLQLAQAGPYGFYQDSFGYDMYDSESRVILGLENSRRWQIAPLGGEVRFYKNPELGADINDALSDNDRRAQLVRWFRRGQTNHMGLENLTPVNEANQQHGDMLHKMMGYRFVVTKAVFNDQVQPGGPLGVALSVVNKGLAPFYYDWPLQVALLDTETKQPAWSARMRTADLRKWLPVSGWDEQKKQFASSAKEYTVKQQFEVPEDLPAGNYTVAIAIVDPNGGELPAVRFAIENYWQGGWHPLGIVGVGEKPQQSLDSAIFFADGVDPTLRYEISRTVKRKNLFTIGENDGSSAEFEKWTGIESGDAGEEKKGASFYLANGDYRRLRVGGSNLDWKSDREPLKNDRLDGIGHPDSIFGNSSPRDQIFYYFQLDKADLSDSAEFVLTLDLLRSSPSAKGMDKGQKNRVGEPNRFRVLMNGNEVGDFETDRDYPLKFIQWTATAGKAIAGSNVVEITGWGNKGSATVIDQVLLDIETK